MKFVNKTLIEIDRELSDLDRFTIDFIEILEKHTNYVIVGGYVAILLGRAHASENIDVIIPKIEFSTFQSLINDLKHNGFYCLNAEETNDIYEYLTEYLAVRFAKKDTIIPNIEMKCAKINLMKLHLKRL